VGVLKSAASDPAGFRTDVVETRPKPRSPGGFFFFARGPGRCVRPAGMDREAGAQPGVRDQVAPDRSADDSSSLRSSTPFCRWSAPFCRWSARRPSRWLTVRAMISSARRTLSSVRRPAGCSRGRASRSSVRVVSSRLASA